MLAQRRGAGLSIFLAVCLINGVFPLALSKQSDDFYDIRFMFNLTKQLHSRYNFETFVTFNAERKLQRPTSMHIRSLDRTLHEELNMPAVVCGLQSNTSLVGILNSKTLAFVSINELAPDLEPMLDVIHTALDGRHNIRILFVLKKWRNRIPSRSEQREFFAWCWRRKFTNVALTFQGFLASSNGSRILHNELFSYTPFPTLQIINLTSLGTAYHWEPLDVSNVHGYEFRVPVFQDLLSAFQLPNGQIYGSFGLLLATFIARIKGQLRVIATPHVNQQNYHAHTLLATARGEIDIGVHLYTQMTLNAELAEGALTDNYMNTCLMVPWQRELPLVRFMRHSIRSNGVLLLVLVVTFPLGWQLCARDGSRGFHYVLTAFFMQSLEERTYRRLLNAYKFIHLAILMGSFLLWNMRTAHLSSIISTKAWGDQINSVDDFLKTPLRIMLTETEVAMYFTRALLPSALQDRLVVVNSSTLLLHRDSLNTSYAYCCNTGLWRILQAQQQRLLRPLFRRAGPRLCTPTYIRSFPLQRNSPFGKDFLMFYTSLNRFGFWQKWQDLSYLQAIKMGLIKMYEDKRIPFAMLGLHDFHKLLQIYVFLISCCFLCLFAEILWKRCAQRAFSSINIYRASMRE